MSDGRVDSNSCVDRMELDEHPRRSTRRVKERRLTLIDAKMAGQTVAKKVCAKRPASEVDTGSQQKPRKAGKSAETDTASQRSQKASICSTASTVSKERPISPQKGPKTDTGVSEDPFTKRRVGRQFEGVMKGCRALLTQIMIHKVRMWSRKGSCFCSNSLCIPLDAYCAVSSLKDPGVLRIGTFSLKPPVNGQFCTGRLRIL